MCKIISHITLAKRMKSIFKIINSNVDVKSFQNKYEIETKTTTASSEQNITYIHINSQIKFISNVI